MKIRRVEKMPVRLDSVEYGTLFRCANDRDKTILMKVNLFGAASVVAVANPESHCFVLNFETGNIFVFEPDRRVIPIPTDNIELVWSDPFNEE